MFYSEFSTSYESSRIIRHLYQNVIDFSNATPNEKGMIAGVCIGNPTNETVDIPEGSLFWIDGEDADDFIADTTDLPHMEIYSNNSVFIFLIHTKVSR